jgi:hypothetical protein
MSNQTATTTTNISGRRIMKGFGNKVRRLSLHHEVASVNIGKIERVEKRSKPFTSGHRWIECFVHSDDPRGVVIEYQVHTAKAYQTLLVTFRPGISIESGLGLIRS